MASFQRCDRCGKEFEGLSSLQTVSIPGEWHEWQRKWTRFSTVNTVRDLCEDCIVKLLRLMTSKDIEPIILQMITPAAPEELPAIGTLGDHVPDSDDLL